MLSRIPLVGRLSRNGSSSDADSPNSSGKRGEFTRGPLDDGNNCWSEPDATSFSVRGKMYLVDNVKVESLDSAFSLLDVDLFESTVGKIPGFSQHPESYVQSQLRSGAGAPFFFVLNFATDRHHLVITYGVDEAKFRGDNPLVKLWNAFLNGSPEYRQERLKVIPRIIEGAWVLRKAIGERPAIMARKLAFEYYQTEQYLEVVCDTSTRGAAVIVEAVATGAPSMVLDLAFVLEGQDLSELPERILGTMRVSRILLRRARLLGTPAEGDE